MKKKIQAPIGVIIVSLFLVLLAFSYLSSLSALPEVISTQNLIQESSSASPSATAQLQRTLAIMGLSFTDLNVKLLFIALGIFALGFSIIILIFSYKLYRGRKWAKNIIVVCAFVVALVMLIRTIVSGFTSISTLSNLVISLTIGIYLSASKKVHKFFYMPKNEVNKK